MDLINVDLILECGRVENEQGFLLLLDPVQQFINQSDSHVFVDHRLKGGVQFVARRYLFGGGLSIILWLSKK